MKRTASKCWAIYIVRCRDGTLYTGVTTDLIRRLQQHQAGHASRYTRARLPVALIYSEPGFTHSQALRREAAIKALPRQQKLALVRSAA